MKSFLCLLLTAGMLAGADHYIRPGAAGDNSGADWNNAFTAFPASLTRGATYYIADGTYPGYTFDDAVSGTAVITIKKATASDHGTDTGWDDGYGDGQAVFDRLVFTTSYWVFDGSGRTGWESGYGIMVKPADSLNRTEGIRLTNTTHNVFRFLEVAQHGQLQSETKQGGFYGQNANDILIQYCYIHDFMGNGTTVHGKNNIIEHTFFTGGFGYGGVHSQCIQLFSGAVVDMTIRYNLFEEVHGTAHIACAWGTNGLYIYGNVFNMPDGSSASPATIVDISEPGETGLSNAHIYNNTFYRYPSAVGGNPGLYIQLTPDSTSNFFYNNAFYDCNPDGGKGVCLGNGRAVHGNNHLISSKLMWNAELGATDRMYDGPDPFIDGSNRDFRITSGSQLINAGLDLTSVVGFNPVVYDPLGTDRNADDGWDVGAYEYTSAELVDPVVHIQAPSFRPGPLHDIYGRTVYGLEPAPGVYFRYEGRAGQVVRCVITR